MTTADRPQSAAPDPLMDLWEVGDYLNMSEPAVRRLVRDRIIPVIKLGGRPKSRIRVRRSDLDALIAASLTPATSGPLAKHGESCDPVETAETAAWLIEKA